MLNVGAVLRRQDRSGLSEPDEAAHVLAEVYRSLGVADTLAQKRRRLRIGIVGAVISALLMAGGVAGLAVVTTALVGMSAAGIVLLLMSVWLIVNSIQKELPVRGVKVLTKIPWVLGLHPLGGKTVVVDESGFLQTMPFKLPVLVAKTEEVRRQMEEIGLLLTRRPILMERTVPDDTDPESGVLKGREEAELHAALRSLAQSIGETRDEIMELPALRGSSAAVGYLGEELSSAVVDEVPHVFRGIGTERYREKIEALEDLSARREIARGESAEPSGGSEPKTELEEFVGDTDETLHEIDSVRSAALMGLLGEQLRGIDRIFNASVRHFYCKECVERNDLPQTVYEEGMVGEPANLGAITSVAQVNQAVEQAKQLAGSSRLRIRDVCPFCSRPVGAPAVGEERYCDWCQRSLAGEDKPVQQWYCPVCAATTEVGSVPALDYFPSMYRVKEEIILPLWDVLWGELAAEKRDIIRDKEQEQRANNSAENTELQVFAREFAEDRRILRSRLDEVNERSIGAVSTLKGVIQAFADNGLLKEDDVGRFYERSDRYHAGHQQAIQRIRQSLLDQEQQIAIAIDSRLGGGSRAALFDPEDEIKVKGRLYLPRAEEWRIVLAEAADTDDALSSGEPPSDVEELEGDESSAAALPAPREGVSEPVFELGGDPAAGAGTAYLVVTRDGRPMEGIDVVVNNREIGLTDADGQARLLVMPEETTLHIRAFSRDREERYEREIILPGPALGQEAGEDAPPAERQPDSGREATEERGPLEQEIEFEIEGDPLPGATVSLVLRRGGEPVERVRVYVDGDDLGETNASGRVQVVIAPGASSLPVRAKDPAVDEWLESAIDLISPGQGCR